MQTVCFKDHGGTLQNPVTQASPVPFVPWWGVAGSQPVVYREQFGQLKSMSVDHPNGGQLSGALGQVHQGTNQVSSIAIHDRESYGSTKISTLVVISFLYQCSFLLFARTGLKNALLSLGLCLAPKTFWEQRKFSPGFCVLSPRIYKIWMMFCLLLKWLGINAT